ncbi:iron complex outermembrane receptor protein [Natronospira proteinivora]|uniref:Iron complex outermembrane receptor protein n=1 Tax=Natronospira proteinivora TaxID=1807133 RepID=A0ABT1G8F4_9GAMM|nr:TonB-dependent receptor [Natronospira proteinivora]MCP1727575.1 iron complex outermembrane receptor protein [Natronospira proteinivora]
MRQIFAVLFVVHLVSFSDSVQAGQSDPAEENPVTTAGDAFGTSIGGESIGLYQAGNVRGFSPVDAGNVRVGGLYFDQLSAFTGRLVSGTTIRVGPTTLADPFSAPTGIADVRIRTPEQQPDFRIAPQVNSNGGRQIELDAQLPLEDDRLNVGLGIGQYEHRYSEGGDSSVTSIAVIPHWQPAEGVEVMPFWSYTDTRDMDVSLTIHVDDDHLPPEISRHRYASQRWATTDRTRANYGVLAGASVGRWTLRSGLFRSIEKPLRSFSVQFRETDSEGRAERTVIANPSQRFGSTSGEIRLSRGFEAADANHQLHLSLRGREQSRRYGGSDQVNLGPGQIGSEAPVPEPQLQFGDQTLDEVQQWTAGVAYQGHWPGVAEVSVGLQRADYRKQVVPPEGALPSSIETPWLYNASGILEIDSSLALYANYSRGLEESPVAPEVAANRDEAPPALRTEQTDFGLHWQTERGLQLIAGVFQIDKPYFAMDAEDIFRQLGKQRHEGVELSLSGEPLPGLTLVTGATLMDPVVTTDTFEAETIGERPVGTARHQVIADLNYRLRSLPALSLDVSAEYSGRRMANLENTLKVSGTTVVNLGARYRFRWNDKSGFLRLRLSNAFDDFSWEVRGDSAFAYNSPRQVTLRATMDF